jgi:SAM-dependent methyltransferase
MCFLFGKRVLDAGCGRGDFAAYLLNRGIEFERYIGIEAMPELADFAHRRGLRNTEFHRGDFLLDPQLLSRGSPQVVCISGTLNTMTDPQIEAVLQAAWEGASEALIFNFLSDRAGPQAPKETGFVRRLDPLRLLGWALERTPTVSFRQDYFKSGHDATILMRKSLP